MDTYEQKYKEALERARTIVENQNASSVWKDWLCNTFPELKSEDEKAKEEIKQLIQCMHNADPRKERWLAWLEKQGESSDQIHYWTEEEIEPIISDYLRGAEHYGGMIGRLRCLKPKSLEKQSKQNLIDYNDELKKCRENPLYFFDKYVKLEERKPADKVEPKFKVGDWVIDKQGIVHQIANVIMNVTNNTYGYDIVGGGYFNDNTEGVRLWTIDDAKAGNVLAASDGSIFIFASVDGSACKHYVAITTDGVFNINEGLEHYWETSEAAHPAEKGQRELLFSKIKEAGYEWDADKKELKKISQRMVSVEAKEAMYDKPTDEEMKELLRTEYEKGRADAIAEMQKGWSEEDECILFRIINDLKFLKDTISIDPNYAVNITDIEREIDWLKSLKDRGTWKPSDEQMDTLLSEVTAWTKGCLKQKVLESLYNDLKKLREE